MNEVKERIEELKKLKEIRDRGEEICIPFHKSYPKLSNFIPGIVKGIMYKITANSGIGKTQLAKNLFCITPLEYIRNNPDTKIKVKILYFAFEESKEEFIDSLIVTRLATKFNIRTDVLTLKCYREDYPDDILMKKIEECEEDVQYYMNHIQVVDSTYNPTGVYKFCRSFSEKNGKHVWKDVVLTKNGEEITEQVYSHYEPDDPNLHVIVVADHISLLAEEYDSKLQSILTKHQTIAKWSTDYCKKQITKHWGWTVVNVQQQEQGSEKQQYTNAGQSIVQKTEPSLDALANNKEVLRDDYVVIGVYSPDRYGFSEYHNYDIDRFRGTFIAIKILKNRLGTPNKYVHFLFDGATNRFTELPLPDEKEKLEKYYLAADKLLGR